MHEGARMVLLLVAAASIFHTALAIKCGDGYTCFEQSNGVVWVMLNKGNINGPTCSDVCSKALCGSGTFHNCDPDRAVLKDSASFEAVAKGLGFTCTKGGCWGGEAPGTGLMLVSIDTKADGSKGCYFPTEDAYTCDNHPGNANCFGERYASICPCAPKALTKACPWKSPPNIAAMATWPQNPQGTTCLERINYWRKRACDEGWPECPPCGLPPMTECVGCHACANSQAEYDGKNGAHKSFTRCGDMVQGSGGGKTCANVIDAFVSERQVFPDSGGKVVCRGHCGPIVAHGCQTFFWGRAETTSMHTLNWRTCNTNKCDAYCANPTGGKCFSHPDSPTFDAATTASKTAATTDASVDTTADTTTGSVVATTVSVTDSNTAAPTTKDSGNVCADGYTCFEQSDGVVWVMLDKGNTNGPTCANVCSEALANGASPECDADRSVLKDSASFVPVAKGLGFTCTKGGCWGGEAPGTGLMLVSIDTKADGSKRCYFPTEDAYQCNKHPGNANCFGERYATVCPCATKTLAKPVTTTDDTVAKPVTTMTVATEDTVVKTSDDAYEAHKLCKTMMFGVLVMLASTYSHAY